MEEKNNNNFRYCTLKTPELEFRIETISIMTSATMSLGNFQSIKPSAGITIIPEHGQEIEEIFKAGWDFVDKQVVTQIKKWQNGEK